MKRAYAPPQLRELRWLVRVDTVLATHTILVRPPGYLVLTRTGAEDVLCECDTLDEARDELGELIAKDLAYATS
jgi:hypothetical protein